MVAAWCLRAGDANTIVLTVGVGGWGFCRGGWCDEKGKMCFYLVLYSACMFGQVKLLLVIEYHFPSFSFQI